MIAGRIKRKEEYEEDFDSGIVNVITPGVREKKVLVIDADSLFYTTSYRGKDEITGEKLPDWTLEEYPLVQEILWENIMQIINNVEEYFNIGEQFYICVKGKGNFRYDLYPQYKANRPPSPSIIPFLRDWLIIAKQAIPADGFESDDLCYSMALLAGLDNTIIATPDKDFLQVNDVILYDYCKNVWKQISHEEAKYRLALQTLTGDSTDNIPGVRGIGPKKAEKIVYQGMTDFQYTRAIYSTYKKHYGEQAKKELLVNYNLVKFHNTNQPAPII